MTTIASVQCYLNEVQDIQSHVISSDTRPTLPPRCLPTLWTFSQRMPVAEAERPERQWCTDWQTTCWRNCHRTTFLTRYGGCLQVGRNEKYNYSVGEKEKCLSPRSDSVDVSKNLREKNKFKPFLFKW